MPKPIAYFSYSKIAKVLSLRDLSLNSPTSYIWDFGDGNTSIVKNPVHQYQEDGFYKVSLISTNVDGASDILEINLGIGAGTDTLNVSLLEYININIPLLLVPELTTSDKITHINKWQNYLQPLVFIPYKVKAEDINNELAWPGLVNTLIALLVSYDLTSILANRAMNRLLTGISDNSLQPGGENDGVKKINTGPTEVEFQDASDDSINNAKIISSIISGKDGSIASIKTSICILSHRLRIYLPGLCEKLSSHVILPVVSNSSVQYKYFSYGDLTFPILTPDIIRRIGLNKNIGLAYHTDTAIIYTVDTSDLNYYYYGFLYNTNIGDFWRIIKVPTIDINSSMITDSNVYPLLDFNTAFQTKSNLTYN